MSSVPATLTINISEDIFLNNNYRNSSVTETEGSIASVDNRIFNIPVGGTTQVVAFTGSLAGALAGNIQASSLAYLRLTNIDTQGTLNLLISGSISSSYEVQLQPQNSHIINNTWMIGGTEQIASVSAYVYSGTTPIALEYYSATY
jgi:hypothetical protein